MRQAQIDSFGPADVLHVVDDARPPAPDATHVRVRVLVAGTNPIDYKIREGSHKLVAGRGPEIFPLVCGREACGVLLDPAGDLPVGTRVMGMVDAGFGGCYAEECLLPTHGVVAVPEGVSSAVAGGSSLAWLTAVEAAEGLGRVHSDDIVLIHGAGGGVGLLITQLCVDAGAEVWASASARHHDRLEAMGAHHVDYNEVDVCAATPRPTLIIDCVYFGTYEPSLDHLAEGGRIVMLPSLADLEPARARGIEISVPAISPDRSRLQRLADGLGDGSIHVHVAHELPLEDAAEAHRILESGHAGGKVVLRVAEG